MNEVFLDTETTGLSYKENHRIVEIACIETKELTPTNKVFHRLINPKRNVPQEAFKIHGFSTEFLSNKETFDNVADDLAEFIKGKKIIIHNAPFDLGFINHELRLVKKDEIKSENIVDTLDLARGKFPGTSNSLDALCRRFNISLAKRTKHNALLDCELLREVYINLLDAKEPKLKLSNENNHYASSNSSEILSKYSKKIIIPSEEELKLHNNFIKKEIKKNFY